MEGWVLQGRTARLQRSTCLLMKASSLLRAVSRSFWALASAAPVVLASAGRTPEYMPPAHTASASRTAASFFIRIPLRFETFPLRGKRGVDKTAKPMKSFSVEGEHFNGEMLPWFEMSPCGEQTPMDGIWAFSVFPLREPDIPQGMSGSRQARVAVYSKISSTRRFR